MLSKTKCRLGANRETSPWKDNPINFDSLITASKWTSCNVEWQNKISSLCLNTVAGYSEEAPSILWVYDSYAYQYPSTSCTDFRVNSKFSANRGSYLQWFSWLKHWTTRFCADFSRSVANRMQVITNKIHQNTLIKRMRLFFPWELDRLSFSRASGRDSKQNQAIKQYSLRSRDVHSTPSRHKWSDFEYRPWCLAIVVRTPPAWWACGVFPEMIEITLHVL